MTTQGSLLRGLVGELSAFGRYVDATMSDEAGCLAIGSALGIPLAPRARSAPRAAPADDPLERYAAGDDIDPLALLEALTQRSGSIKSYFAGLADELVALALDLLATRYVHEHHPKTYFLMQFLGFLAESGSQFGQGWTTVDRALRSIIRLLGLLVFGMEDPRRSLTTEADAQAISNPTLRLAAIVLLALRIANKEMFQDWTHQELLDMHYGWDAVPAAPGVPPEPADLISRRMLSLRWDLARDQDDDLTRTGEASLGLSLALVPEEHGGPGLFAALSGGEDLDFPIANRLQARVELDATALPMWYSTTDGFRADVPAGMRAAVTLGSRLAQGQKFFFAFPDTDTLRLEVGAFSAQASIEQDGPRLDLALRRCELMFDASKIDTFILSLLPDYRTKLKFDIGLRYAPDAGLAFTGAVTGGEIKKVPAPGAPTPPPQAPKPAEVEPPLPPMPAAGGGEGGLQLRFHLGRSIGPARLDDLEIGVTGSADPMQLEVSAGVSISAQIGPVMVRVDRVGLRAALSLPPEGQPRNLHLAHLDLGFLPPRALGLRVDAGAVQGGGYLFHDEAKKQYAGVLELQIAGWISLKAIGLVSTQLPDGRPGWSMVIIITAERLPPLPAPMGFRLTGVGGMLGVHRTSSIDALRDGLKNKTLDLILFPQDPLRNAPNILLALERVFPARRGSHLAGLMVRFDWGANTPIISFDLAVLYEWGHHHRWIVLGRIQAGLPNLEHSLLRLRMDALGVFDLDEGRGEIDAVLVDSKLLERFVITGEMAMRMRWHSPRNFALSVGGMHRSFTPPADFPLLQRLALNLTTGSNPRLNCEAYFAITANTVQFGALANLYAEGPAGFNVTGQAGFDVLITLSPFHFLAEFLASMQIRKGSRNILKVKVEGALEGPRPLQLRAKATFEIFWWDVSIRVNVTLVSGDRPPPPPSVDAQAELLRALRDPRNWRGELPAAQAHIVVLRDRPADAALLALHPLATLAVRQSVVPLNTAAPIDRVGDAPVSGPRTLRISGVSINGAAEPAGGVLPLREDFAPAQFFDMPDERKLTSPSYVPMEGGVQLAGPASAFKLAQSVASPLRYETKVIDRSIPPAPPGAPATSGAPTRIRTLDTRFELPGHMLEQQARHGAAGRSELRRGEPLPSDAAPAPMVQLQAARFTLLDLAAPRAAATPLARGAAAPAPSTPSEFAATAEALKPRRRHQLVPDFESQG